MKANNLEFALALLELTIEDNRTTMDRLSGTFIELARRIKTLSERMSIEVKSNPGSVSHQALALQSEPISALISENVKAMQLHDITDQRLAHVAALLKDPSLSLESVLTEDAERRLERMVESGTSTSEAIQQAHDLPSSGSVELF